MIPPKAHKNSPNTSGLQIMDIVQAGFLLFTESYSHQRFFLVFRHQERCSCVDLSHRPSSACPGRLYCTQAQLRINLMAVVNDLGLNEQAIM